MHQDPLLVLPAMQIQISDATRIALDEFGGYVHELRGQLTVKIANKVGNMWRGPLFLSWVDLNSSVDKQLHHQNVGCYNLSIPKFRQNNC